jgi:cell division protein FtsN
MSVSSLHRQWGGTFLGFILGVLVGLAGALAVAVYVTKVPVPFVDRVMSRKPAEDAAEAEKNRNWNPNAGLATGKTPPGVKAASADAAPAAPVPDKAAEPPADKKARADAAKAAPRQESETEIAPAKSGQGKAYTSDPLGDLAQAKVQGKAATKGAEASAEPFQYFVQVGAYRAPEDAQAQRAKLALMGLDAKVSEREQAGRTVYRVRMGPYERQDDAEKMKADLQSNGLDSALVRVQR